MRRYLKYVAGLLGLAMWTFTVPLWLTGQASGQTGPQCPDQPAVRCIVMPTSDTTPYVGQEIATGNGSQPGTPWMVTDHNGLPMAWVNLYGLYSGGNGGKTVGGEICITLGIDRKQICMEPQGTLVIYDSAGANPVTLTRQDILYLHQLEGISP